MNNDFWIPRTLDAPPKFFMWDFDVASIWIICIMFGAMMQFTTAGIALAFLLGRSYSRLKEDGGKGLFVKILYWYIPSEQLFGRRLSSHVREYLGG